MKTLIKLVAVVACVAAFVSLLIFLRKNGYGDDKQNPLDSYISKKRSKTESTDSTEKTVTIVAGVNADETCLPLLYLNGGTEPNENCLLYKEYGLKMKIIASDESDKDNDASGSDSTNVRLCNIGLLPLHNTKDKLIAFCGWSRGREVIVAKAGINSIDSLARHSIACSRNSSIAFAVTALSQAKVRIKITEEDNDSLATTLMMMRSDEDVHKIFSEGDADAAVLPIRLADKLAGVKTLASSKDYPNAVCFGLMADEGWLIDNKGIAVTLVSAILNANSTLNNDARAMEEARIYFTSAMHKEVYPLQDRTVGLEFASAEDNISFFGLNFKSQGINGETLYNSMARSYNDHNINTDIQPWRKVSDISIIEPFASESGSQQ